MEGIKKYIRLTLSVKSAFMTGCMLKSLKTNSKQPSCQRFIFFGFIKEKEDKLKIIDDMIQKTEEVRDGLSAYYKQITALEFSDKEREIGKYQIKTLDYGVMSHEVAVEWLYKLRDEII